MSQIKKYLSTDPRIVPAVVCYILKKKKVLLGLRKKVTLGLGQNLIAGIGGKIEDGESEEDALIREVKEEIGLELLEFQNVGKVIYLFPHKPAWNQEVSIFTSSKWKGTEKETDVIRPAWFKFNRLPKDQMWEDNLYTVPEILKNRRIDAKFLYGSDKQVSEYQLTVAPV